MELGKGATLEPFVRMNSDVDMETAGTMLRGETGGGDAQKSIGAGMSLSQSDEYNFEATADVNDPGNGSEREVRGGVKLTIPLR